MSTANKKRPKIDFTVPTGERKRGKSMFGIVLGTLNKAKLEDKERNASEAVRLNFQPLRKYTNIKSGKKTTVIRTETTG